MADAQVGTGAQLLPLIADACPSAWSASRLGGRCLLTAARKEQTGTSRVGYELQPKIVAKIGIAIRRPIANNAG